MSKQSLDDFFLKEMAAEPKTLRWDVIAAFDRDKTNYLLLQEYISRFNTASIIPPYDSFVGREVLCIICAMYNSTHRACGLRGPPLPMDEPAA